MSVAFVAFLVCWIAALIGNFFPAVPAILLVLIGAIAATYLQGFNPARDIPFLIVLGVFSLLVVLVDNFASAWGAQKYGGSKAGVWGAVVGGLAGLFFPLGLLWRPLAGALIFEMLFGKRPFNEALRSAWGTLVGMLTGMAAKFVLMLVLGLYELWRLWEPVHAAVGTAVGA